jgi:hypothetical protein
MDQYWRGRNPAVLLALMVPAIAYGALLNELGTLTGVLLWDGVIGVALGLYICSHPVSNAIDLLFMDHGIMRHGVADTHGLAWYGLNLIVMCVGCLVIVIGMTRFLT